jgi:hypothetical protein
VRSLLFVNREVPKRHRALEGHLSLCGVARGGLRSPRTGPGCLAKRELSTERGVSSRSVFERAKPVSRPAEQRGDAAEWGRRYPLHDPAEAVKASEGLSRCCGDRAETGEKPGSNPGSVAWRVHSAVFPRRSAGHKTLRKPCGTARNRRETGVRFPFCAAPR